MLRSKGISAVLTAMVGLACMGLAGCMTADKKITPIGLGPAPQSSLKQVHVGKTTEQWVLTTLGKPSSEDQADGGRKILKYEYGQNVENRLDFGLLFVHLRDNKDARKTVYFEVADGVVTKYWTE